MKIHSQTLKANSVVYLCYASTLLLLSGCVNLSVKEIDVSQAIQDGANSVQLVTNRSTTLRVRVGTGGMAVSGVNGKLHVYVDNAEITPAAGVSPINGPFNAPAPMFWNRNQENHTLNFELPAPTNITASSNVDFVVNLEPHPNESNTSDNTGQLLDLISVDRSNPRLYFTRINFAAIGFPALGDVQAGVGDAFVLGIYPVDDSDPDLYTEGLFPTLTYNADPNGNARIDGGEASDLLDGLESIRQLIVNGASGNTDNIFLYGWVKGNPIDGNGWATVGGRIAFGNTQHIRYQRTYAHELGHNFGLYHNSRTLSPDVGWDTGGRLDGNPAGNNTTGRVKGSTLNDIMSPGRLTDSAWVDMTTYTSLLGNSVIGPASSDTGGDTSGNLTGRRIAVISGVLDSSGTRIIRLNPVFRYPWLSEASPYKETGIFTAELVDDQGTIYTANFDGLIANDAEGGNDEIHGFFSLRIKVPETREIESLTIFRTDDRKELALLKRSQPPQIDLKPPATGFKLGKLTEISWNVSDPDTPLKDLRIQLAYSADEGLSWVPIGVNIIGTQSSLSFNSTEILNTKGASGIIRALVSDGLNTVCSEIKGFEVSRGRMRR